MAVCKAFYDNKMRIRNFLFINTAAKRVYQDFPLYTPYLFYKYYLIHFINAVLSAQL